MPSITVSKQITAPAEAVWALLADFADVTWIPGAAKVEVEGEGPGMSRKIYGAGDTPIVETLLWVEPEHRRLAYEIANNPMPVNRFEAVVSVTGPDDTGDGCHIGWDVDYEPAGEDASARESIELVYTMMADWLRDAANAAAASP